MQRWSLRSKILSVGIVLPLLLVTGLFVAYYFQYKGRVVEGYVKTARALCLTVESARDQMERKWEQGLFTTEMMREAAEAGDRTKLLGMVPVVTAWEAAMEKAAEGGYEFRVPKFHPRNPKNEPDPLEARVLRHMEDKKLQEYHEIDQRTNTVRYFRAVVLSENCMLCHGDPATSVALWGNSEGRDPTGGKMEDWKVGQRHGAFEVLQRLDAADRELRASTIMASGSILGGLLLLALIFIATICIFRPEWATDSGGARAVIPVERER